MIWRGIGVFAAVALLGAGAGRVVTADDQPPTTSTVHAGAVTLSLAGGWHAVDPTTLSDGHRRMRVVLGSPVSRADAGKAARLGGYRGWSYGRVTALESTRGTLSVACEPSPCDTAVRSLSIAGAAILAPAPDLALRLRAPAALAAFDTARVSARAALQAAPAAGPAAREQAVRLAAAHRTALNALRALTDPAPGTSDRSAPATATSGAALLAALAGGEHAYDRLANANSPAEFDSARPEVVAADRAVEVAVAGLARAGAPPVQAPLVPAGDTPAGGGASLLTLLLVLATALLVSALGPAGVRRVRLRRAHEHAPAADDSCVLASLRRAPIAPPPTYGRWNEAPRGPGAAPEDGARTPATASSSTT